MIDKIYIIAQKMIDYSNKNMHDINHFLKVFGFAQIIAKNEGLNKEQLNTLLISALLHDIACPLCREKYGNTNGVYQEKEGEILAREFLNSADIKKLSLKKETVERAVFIVGHHHSPKASNGLDFDILLEADFLVNANESNFSSAVIKNAYNNLFKTKTGKGLLKSMYKF